MPLRELILQTYWRVPIYELDVPSVEFSGDWNTYAQQLSKKQRSSLARKHRRLLDLGDIKFEELPYDTPGVAEWIVEHKRKWLVRNALEDKVQLTHPMFIKFLNGLLAALGPEARCLVFAIRQGERLIAADVSFVDRHAVQWKIGTFDEEFGKYSPGQLLKEMAVRWAFDHGLIYDMLAGGGQHKDYLATKIERATTWRVGRTALGRCYIAIRRLLQRAGFPSMITPGR
jgi:CelD/BcsL family acetyltransferase involved in cellulose biosynthesis